MGCHALLQLGPINYLAASEQGREEETAFAVGLEMGSPGFEFWTLGVAQGASSEEVQDGRGLEGGA